MGTISSPANPPRTPTGRPAPGGTPAGGTPPLSPNVTSRLRFEQKQLPMGPSGTAILLVLAAIGIGAWLYFKPPSSIGDEMLQKYTGFEANLEAVSLSRCAPPGCAGIYLTPTVGKSSVDALPGAVVLANQLAEKGIECFVIIGGEPIQDAVKRARALHRPVVFDPFGAWASSTGIEKAPAWLVWRSGGSIRLRSSEPVTVADVAAALR